MSSTLLYLFWPPGNFSNWFLLWNIQKEGCSLICHTTGQIFINPWNVVYENYHTYGKKCIALTQPYTCDIKRRNPIMNSTSSTLFLPLPTPPPTNIIHFLISKLLQKIPNLIMIKTTQYMSPIEIFYKFLKPDHSLKPLAHDKTLQLQRILSNG